MHGTPESFIVVTMLNIETYLERRSTRQRLWGILYQGLLFRPAAELARLNCSELMLFYVINPRVRYVSVMMILSGFASHFTRGMATVIDESHLGLRRAGFILGT